MQILIEHEINREKWTNFLLGNQYSSPFQSPEYYEFYNKVPNQTALVFAIQENNELKALCLVTLQKEKGFKRYFSRRAIIYGGPLVAPNNDFALESLIIFINSYLRKKVIFAESRNLNDYNPGNSSFLKQGWEYIPYLNFQIKLKSKNFEELFSEMKYNRKREIKLSIKEGASYRIAESICEVKSLYQILAELYSQRIGRPLPDVEYFLELFHSPIGKVFIVEHDHKVIGGCFCVYYTKGSIYTLYYCGLRDYHYKIYPTHLAIVAVIEYGLKNNLQMLDLMGAGKPNEEYGVRKYKSEFGGMLVEYGRFRKIYNPLLFKIGEVGLGLMQILK
jgi:lipid II:glycine glycyltransferase (peptidoglycan interpeptide bridge formation enzyme)